MLTLDDKYKLCPAFNHLINRPPIIGDYVLSYEGLYIVQNIFEHYDEYDDIYETYMSCYSIYHEEKYGHFYCDYTTHLNVNTSEYIILTKEMAQRIIDNISHKEYEKIIDVIVAKDDDIHDYDQIYFIYMILYRLYTYFNSLVTDDMDKMILLSFGIKKVLKKHKNNGFRDVLLGNGQVWRLKKRKIKGMQRKQIASNNRRIANEGSNTYKKKIKTVKYSIVKRLE